MYCIIWNYYTYNVCACVRVCMCEPLLVFTYVGSSESSSCTLSYTGTVHLELTTARKLKDVCSEFQVSRCHMDTRTVYMHLHMYVRMYVFLRLSNAVILAYVCAVYLILCM